MKAKGKGESEPFVSMSEKEVTEILPKEARPISRAAHEVTQRTLG